MSADVGNDALARAARAAVEASSREMAKIAGRVGSLEGAMRRSAASARDAAQAGAEGDQAARFAAHLEQTLIKVTDLIERQTRSLQTFNVVLFGRTGAGKSSLISALTRGDGSAVSRGESDWTTRVDPVAWHSCRVYDTPGINGWGRTESRFDLETRAREAVEVADFVLVCFDSQSQQADEFHKLAAWVQTYRKPLVAVLNPRNAIWRVPTRVPFGTARAGLSRAVREHAGNIRDELAKIGLSGVPVIALSCKRAHFARASLPYRGPDAVAFMKQRDELGVDTLERWSAFPRLEQLLTESIANHAVAIRVGALNDQLRGVLEGLSDGLGHFEADARAGAETIEKDLVGPLLCLLGYPPRGDAERRKPLLRGSLDLLGELERLRGGAFQASVDGDFRQFVRQRLEAALGALRSRSLQNGEECVVSAFERRSSLSAEAVRKASFDESAMKSAAQGVLAEGAEYLEKRVTLLQRDTKLDLQVLARGAQVNGDAGEGWKYGAWAIKGGGILAGAAAALGAFAVANFWNPAGWTAAAAAGVAFVGSVVAGVFGWLGRKARDAAEEKRLEARCSALAEVRRNVHAVYDGFRDEVLAHAHRHVLGASKEVLRGPIVQAVSLREIMNHARSLLDEIKRLTDDLPRVESPQALLWETATRLERSAFPDVAIRSQLHWLGEDWIDDPAGLKSAQGSATSERTSAYDPGFFLRLFDGIADVFDRITEDLQPGCGHAWLDGALQRCAGDELATESLQQLKARALGGRVFISSETTTPASQALSSGCS